MRLPSFDAHQAERRADQARVRWLSELLFIAALSVAMAAALFVP